MVRGSLDHKAGKAEFEFSLCPSQLNPWCFGRFQASLSKGRVGYTSLMPLVPASHSSYMTAPRPGRRWTTTGRPRVAPTSCASWTCMRTCIMASAASSSSWNGRQVPSLPLNPSGVLVPPGSPQSKDLLLQIAALSGTPALEESWSRQSQALVL